MKKYEWAIIGSGIAGTSVAEILTREGHSTILIEKNQSLASETTREFHEWLHTGSLFTLIPDGLKTLRFILGAIDDLIEYYSSFDNMNITPSSQGLHISADSKRWFNKEHIHFNYRIKNRKLTFPWLIGIARSIDLITKIENHDWLRRRAGELDPLKKNRLRNIYSEIKKLISFKEKFLSIKTPDCTINSRVLLRDMIETAIFNGLDISLGNKVTSFQKKNDIFIVNGSKETFHAEKIAICCGSAIKDFTKVKVKTSYAPIAVVSDVPQDYNSFVELDYFPKNCINYLKKEHGFGLVGGISFSDVKKTNPYLDYVIKEHQKNVPSLKEVSRYNGIKTEISFKNQPRGYLYHITPTDENIWALIPGKFTLAFSMAPEFYRKIYNKNPRKYFNTKKAEKKNKKIVSNTIWKDQHKIWREKNGND